MGVVRLCVAALMALTLLAPRAWDRDRMQLSARQHGPKAVVAVRALQALLTELQPLDENDKLTAINEFYNQRIVYSTDTQVWGLTDYWASPLEMLEKGRGDCEDYVIAKYFSLVALGVPAARLRLVYVRAVLAGVVQAHMVLAYYPRPGAEPLILDNLVEDMRLASARTDLTPVFSFNSVGLWQGVGTQGGDDPTTRLSPWRDVLAKARAEGFE